MQSSRTRSRSYSVSTPMAVSTRYRRASSSRSRLPSAYIARIRISSSAACCCRVSLEISIIAFGSERFSDGDGNLVFRHAGINLIRPGIDAAVDVLQIFESLLAQELEHAHGAAAVVAMNIILLVRVEFGEALLKLAHL